MIPSLNKEIVGGEREEYLAAHMMETTSCTHFRTGACMMLRMAEALTPKGSTTEEMASRANQFGHMLHEFHPRDAIEGSLCSQAIVCQEKAMQLLENANIQEHPEWAKINYNAASKLLSRAQNALQVLASYRRGGQQKVVVEHANVASGGQAAFGHFEANQEEGGGNQKNKQGTP